MAILITPDLHSRHHHLNCHHSSYLLGSSIILLCYKDTIVVGINICIMIVITVDVAVITTDIMLQRSITESFFGWRSAKAHSSTNICFAVSYLAGSSLSPFSPPPWTDNIARHFIHQYDCIVDFGSEIHRQRHPAFVKLFIFPLSTIRLVRIIWTATFISTVYHTRSLSSVSFTIHSWQVQVQPYSFSIVGISLSCAVDLLFLAFLTLLQCFCYYWAIRPPPTA